MHDPEFPRDAILASAPTPPWLRRSLWLMLAGLVGLHLLEAVSLYGKMGSDYLVYYEGAQTFLRDPMALYPPDAKRTLVGFLYPPPSIFLFLPLLAGSLEDSFLWANAVVLGCGIAGCVLWLRLIREAHGLPADRLVELVILGLAMATGAMMAVRQGQVDTVLLLLCVAPLWLDRKGWPKTAGALIAAGCWIKIYPVLLLFWLFRRPQWRAMLAGFTAAAVAIPLASLVLVPPALYLDYFREQLPSMSGHAIINIDNQSLAAILVRTVAPIGEYTVSFATLPLPAWFRAVVVLAMLGGMAAVVLRVRSTGAPPLLIAAWAMAFACLVAPLGWGHTYCLLLPLFIQTLRLAIARQAWPTCAAIGACYLALLLPAHHRLAIDTLLPSWAAQLFYARYAVAALVLLALSWRQADERLSFRRDRDTAGACG